MRRLLLIVLMLWLPLQSSWAAAAGLCRHEQGAAAQHFGHHEHRHHAAPGTAGIDTQAGASSALMLDDDCALCHLGCAVSLPSAAHLVLVATPAGLAPAQAVPLHSHIPSVPLPPDRRALA